MVRLCLTTVAAACLSLALLSAPQRSTFGALSVIAALLLQVILAIRACRRKVARHEERSFWRDLMITCGLWLAIAALLLWFGPIGTAFSLRLAVEIGTAVYYVLFVRAVESQPDRRQGPAAGLTRRLNLAAIVLFVFGLLAYFWLIPGVLLALLARAARAPRWRLLNSLLMPFETPAGAGTERRRTEPFRSRRGPQLANRDLHPHPAAGRSRHLPFRAAGSRLPIDARGLRPALDAAPGSDRTGSEPAAGARARARPETTAGQERRDGAGGRNPRARSRGRDLPRSAGDRGRPGAPWQNSK